MNEYCSLSDILPRVVSLAERAGEATMDVYDSGDFDTAFKSDDSPLTKADLAANEIIVKGLAEDMGPVFPILSEESRTQPYEERSGWGIFWLVDPLDGTKEFIKRNGEFTVNIALVRDGAPFLGVVRAPALGVTYYADAALGAFRKRDGEEPEPIRSGDYTQGSLKVVATRSHVTPELMDFLRNLGECGIVNIGSSLKFMKVAEGSAHLYPRFGPTMEWDTAAAQVIVEEAGGRVTDLSGKPLRYNKENLLNPFFMVTGAPPYPWVEKLDGGGK